MFIKHRGLLWFFFAMTAFDVVTLVFGAPLVSFWVGAKMIAIVVLVNGCFYLVFVWLDAIGRFGIEVARAWWLTRGRRHG